MQTTIGLTRARVSMPRPAVRRAQVSCSASASDVAAMTQLKLKSAAKNLPHPDKMEYGGEDGFFMSDVRGGAVGVADGVGGWADSGINPADYSKTFMKNAQSYLEGLEVTGAKAPQEALAAAHRDTRLPGSSTAVVLALDPESKQIKAANVGDSGFMIIRNKKPVFRSPPLQHFFDCPLQFGAFPEHVDATDSAADAQLFEIDVQVGDVIVMASDGLWDNCFAEDIAALAPKTVEDVQTAADKMANLARMHAADERYKSPYTQEAISQGYDLEWWEKVLNTRLEDGKLIVGELEGGKMDDITVVVAYVTEEDIPPPPPPVEEEDAEVEEAAPADSE